MIFEKFLFLSHSEGCNGTLISIFRSPNLKIHCRNILPRILVIDASVRASANLIFFFLRLLAQHVFTAQRFFVRLDWGATTTTRWLGTQTCKQTHICTWIHKHAALTDSKERSDSARFRPHRSLAEWGKCTPWGSAPRDAFLLPFAGCCPLSTWVDYCEQRALLFQKSMLLVEPNSFQWSLLRPISVHVISE